MTIPQTPAGGVNPSHTSATPVQPSCSATLATLRAAARDAQVTRAALAVLVWLATDTNAWKPFSVASLASVDMLNISRETVSRALRGLSRLGYIEERKPRHARAGEREARLILVAPGAAR